MQDIVAARQADRNDRYNQQTLEMAYRALCWAFSDVQALEGSIGEREAMAAAIMDARRRVNDCSARLARERYAAPPAGGHDGR